jgi:hypothetical protein
MNAVVFIKENILILIVYDTLREYSWNDWMRNPKNKELYNKDSKEGLRQFQLEKQRRDNHIKSVQFKINGL